MLRPHTTPTFTAHTFFAMEYAGKITSGVKLNIAEGEFEYTFVEKLAILLNSPLVVAICPFLHRSQDSYAENSETPVLFHHPDTVLPSNFRSRSQSEKGVPRRQVTS
jgi:hypothetical protein